MKVDYAKGFSSKRIAVRPYARADFQTWREAHLSRLSKQNKFDSVKPSVKEVTLAKFKEMLKKNNKRAMRDECYYYGVFDKKTGENVGAVSLYILIRKGLHWANLGYEIHNQYWRQGYATEAARLTLKIGFRYLSLHRIEAAMELDHKGSIGVARAIGMRREGIRRKFFPNPTGWEDLVVFGVVKEDFES
ncbi:MAG: GNAT family N-acetyltransferase [Bdellovibrio sp.]|nr:GNAT family N-acetyltransferase [Bdellovibrio sp.]